MNQELVAVSERPEALVLSAIDVRRQVNLIQEVMARVMQRDVHYGVVPGCGDKPTLLKAGAEKLCLTFRLRNEMVVEEFRDDSEIRYRVLCKLVHIPTGQEVGQGVGTASTVEEKYAWQAAVCQEEWDSKLERERRVKFQKGNWDKAANAYGSPKKVLQIRRNGADLENTVLKMAKKRALVDAILTATAASDIFTQDDVEDMGEPVPAAPAPKPTRQDAPGSTNAATKSSTPKPEPKATPVKDAPAEPAQDGPGQPEGGLPLSEDEQLAWDSILRLREAVVREDEKATEKEFWTAATQNTDKNGKVWTDDSEEKAIRSITRAAEAGREKKFLFVWLRKVREKWLTEDENKLIGAFYKLGVKAATVEEYLGKAIYALADSEIQGLWAIYNEVKSGKPFAEAVHVIE